MLGYNSVNQTLQTMVVKEKIRNFLARYSLANNQVFNYFASVTGPEVKKVDSITGFFLDFLFNTFTEELKAGSDVEYSQTDQRFYSKGQDLRFRYALAAIFINNPAFNFETSSTSETYDKGLVALREQFEKSFLEFVGSFRDTFNIKSTANVVLPSELSKYSMDQIGTFLSAMVKQRYFRMISTTWPDSYPLYAGVGPLWNTAENGHPWPQPWSYKEGDGPMTSAAQSWRYLYNGSLQTNKSSLDSNIKINNGGDPYNIMQNLWSLTYDANGKTKDSPFVYYLEVFFRLKKSAANKIKVTGPDFDGFDESAYYRGSSFVGDSKDTLEGKKSINGGWTKINESIQTNKDILTENKALPSSIKAYLQKGAAYMSQDAFLNDIRLASMYLSYDEVYQLIELSKGPKTSQDAMGQIQSEKSKSFLTLDDFDIGVRLMYNITDKLASAPVVKEDGTLVFSGGGIGNIPYMELTSEIKSDILRSVSGKIQNIINKFNSTHGKQEYFRWSNSQMWLYNGTWNNKGPLFDLNKTIAESVNGYMQKVLSNKSFLQIEYGYTSGDKSDGWQNINWNDLSTGASKWKNDATLLLSLPIAEFVSTDFSTLFSKDPDTLKAVQNIFNKGVSNFLNDTTITEFENKMLPALLFGLSNTENVRYLFEEQMQLSKIMSISPIYNMLRNEDLELAKFFLIGSSPLAEHNKMIDGMLERLINFNER